jgi:4,5-dihydroxyphthalate decarboxylase
VGAEARRQSADFYPLFQDAAVIEAGWYRRTGIYPIHGLVVVKSEILDANPWLAQSLMDAFSDSKQFFLESLRAGIDDAKEFASYSSLRKIVGDDPLPYGIGHNQKSIDALIDFSARQHILAKRPGAEEVFAL